MIMFNIRPFDQPGQQLWRLPSCVGPKHGEKGREEGEKRREEEERRKVSMGFPEALFIWPYSADNTAGSSWSDDTRACTIRSHSVTTTRLDQSINTVIFFQSSVTGTVTGMWV